MPDYCDFLDNKRQLGGQHGFEPIYLPDFLFDFQRWLLEWAIRKGRAAIFADCGLGKGPMSLAFAQNVVQKTNGNVLILCPLAVSHQFETEGEKFGIECRRSSDGKLRSKISVTNYERLHLFDSSEFSAVICDESSAIKHFSGARQLAVTEFMRLVPYRLLCSATPAPNDFIELGTSSEALGEMGRMDMLGYFFTNSENSLHPQARWEAKWRFKAHGEDDFWRWVSSWAKALRRPSDLGFSDKRFALPPLQETEVVVLNNKPLDGRLFPMPAFSLKEQRQERRATLNERCERVAELINDYPSVIWCHLNIEGDLLAEMIPGLRLRCLGLTAMTRKRNC